MKKKNVMVKNLFRTIKSSFGRYLAIVAIIALGASIFVGLLSTKMDMVQTGQVFMDQQNMFDLRLLSTYGWSQAELDKISQIAGVAHAEGSISVDALGNGYASEKDSVYKIHSIPETVNQVYLLSGRMPTSPNECLADGYNSKETVIGTTFTISSENTESTLEMFHERQFTIVGCVSTPLYMDMSRGSTTIGNGTVSAYVYLPMEAFNVDYFTEIDVVLDSDHKIYTDTYNDMLKVMGERMQPDVEIIANDRLLSLKEDALKQYEDGYKEYADGLAEFETERDKILLELADALIKLQDGQKEIDSNRELLIDGLAKLDAAQKEVDKNYAELLKGAALLSDAKAKTYAQLASGYAELSENRKLVTDNLALVKSGLAQIEDGLSQLDNGISQIEDGLDQIEDGLSSLELAIGLSQARIEIINGLLSSSGNTNIGNSGTEQLKEELANAQTELNSYLAQKEEVLSMQKTYSAQLEELKAQRAQIEAQRSELKK